MCDVSSASEIRAAPGMTVCTDQTGCSSHGPACSVSRRTEKECLAAESGYYLQVVSAATSIALNVGIGTIGTDTSASSYTNFISSFKSATAAALSINANQVHVNAVIDIDGTAVEVSFTVTGDLANGEAVSPEHISDAFGSTGVLIADHPTITTIAISMVSTTLDATECTRIDGAANATYTCDSATNSRVSVCDSGHYKVTGATVDACPACTPVPGANAEATYTCTSATDSRVSHCRTAYFKTDGEAGEMDTCTGVFLGPTLVLTPTRAVTIADSCGCAPWR